MQQMRETAEKKREIEKQHTEAVNDLRTAQAQLGLLSNMKNTEPERAQHSQNIESLQVIKFFTLVDVGSGCAAGSDAFWNSVEN